MAFNNIYKLVIIIIIIIQVVKSKRIRWAGHVRQKREIYSQFLWGNMKEKDHLEDPSISGRITSKPNLKKQDRTWNTFNWLSTATDGKLL